MARLQARVRSGGARRRARRATSCTRGTGSSSCAPRDAVPVACLAEAGPAHLSRVRRGRLSPRVAPGHRTGRGASARTCSARRPGSSRATSGARGAAERARRCGAGSSSTRRSSTSTFYCASVTRCYPGRARSGRGDRSTVTGRAAALRALARRRASAAATEAHRHRRRPRRTAAARRDERHRIGRPALRPRRRGRDPTPPSFRRLELAQRSRRTAREWPLRCA